MRALTGNPRHWVCPRGLGRENHIVQADDPIHRHKPLVHQHVRDSRQPVWVSLVWHGEFTTSGHMLYLALPAGKSLYLHLSWLGWLELLRHSRGRRYICLSDLIVCSLVTL